jgi:hypothetical protein
MSASYLNIANPADGLIPAGGSPVISAGFNSAPAGYVSCGIGGPTTTRPTNTDPGASASGITVGTCYLDTTLGQVVCWDGLVWRNPFTGSPA